MEALKGSISQLNTIFHEKMSKFEAELKKSPQTSTDTVAGLAAAYSSFKKFVIESLKCLQNQMEALSQGLDALEMRSRRKILLLHGVAEQTKEDTVLATVGVIKEHLQLDVAETDIRRCHRMGRQADNSKPRPILLKFQDVGTRDRVWFAKNKLKGSGITVSEFLTKTRHNVFMVAREKFGVSKCWTKQGHIHIIGADGTRHRISSLGELSKIAVPDSDSQETQSLQGSAAAAAPRKKRGTGTKK